MNGWSLLGVAAVIVLITAISFYLGAFNVTIVLCLVALVVICLACVVQFGRG